MTEAHDNNVKERKPWQFQPGNPGRPKGAKNHSTRVREAILSQVNRKSIARIKHRLLHGDSREFDKAMAWIIALIGPERQSSNEDTAQSNNIVQIFTTIKTQGFDAVEAIYGVNKNDSNSS